MVTNDFLPFCPTDTGTNLLSESDYAAATDRNVGNQPGVASSKLNNKALRQATAITAQIAQYVGNQLSDDVLDDGISAKLLSLITAALKPYAPKITQYLSGAGTHHLTYLFFIASGNATAAATYSNNGHTFTVVSTVAAGTFVQMTGDGDPGLTGTLTKTGGAGDATLTFYAMRKPTYLRMLMVGGGGGGAGSSSTASHNAGSGGNGGDTTWGADTAGGGIGGVGAGGSNGSGGGAATLSAIVGIAVSGGCGGAGANGVVNVLGGFGGCTALGGAGSQAAPAGTAGPGAANTGAGGSGAGGTGSNDSGGGGASGAYINGVISAPVATYAYSVGAAGAAGAAGTSGVVGAAGGSGLIVVEEHYQ